MSKKRTVREIINLWPSRAALAGDVNSVAGVKVASTSQVHRWADVQSIPAKYHHWIVLAAGRRSLDVDAAALALAHLPNLAGDAA